MLGIGIDVECHADLARLVIHDFTACGLQSLICAVQTSGALLNLDVQGNPLGVREGQCLRDGLRTNTPVTTLSLADTKIGNEWMEILASCLLENRTLTFLSLADNRINDEGMERLSGALRFNSAL